MVHPGLTAGALGPAIVSLNTNKSSPSPPPPPGTAVINTHVSRSTCPPGVQCHCDTIPSPHAREESLRERTLLGTIHNGGSSTWVKVLNVPLNGMLVRSDGVEPDLVLATPHLKTVRICEFSSAIAADDLGADQVVAEPLVRDVRRSGARQKICCLQGCSLAESLVGRRQVQIAPSNQ